jgi:hypothetical protein
MPIKYHKYYNPLCLVVFPLLGKSKCVYNDWLSKYLEEYLEIRVKIHHYDKYA